jgi:hypothetical protein
MLKSKNLSIFIALSLLLSGCAFNPGFLPAFGGWEYGALTQFVDFLDIEHDVQCEVRSFLSDEKLTLAGGISVPSADLAKGFLAYDQPATVTLTLQTDLSGKATAAGINLSKVGLNVIADTITLANKTPTLQANLQAKGTVSAAPVSVIPQTNDDVWRIYILKDGTFVQQNFKVPNTERHVRNYIQQKYKDVIIADDGAVVPGIPPTIIKFPKEPIIKGLARINCDSVQGRRLLIKEWLVEFFARNMEPYTDPRTKETHYRLRQHQLIKTSPSPNEWIEGPITSVSCAQKLTLKTAILVVFDTSAGLNPVISSTYLIPISGFTLDVSPDLMNTLQIDFTLQNSENNDLCEKLLARKPLGS